MIGCHSLQDQLLGAAKQVANATAALVLQAKKVASTAPDQGHQNRVIGAATQGALATSQLVACAKVGKAEFQVFFSFFNAASQKRLAQYGLLS